MPHPVADHSNELYTISGVGVPETSVYHVLSKLLKPKVTAIMRPANGGAGLPDGGFFSTKELKKHDDDRDSLFGKLKPERGFIEVKALDADLSSFESSPQVRNYLEHFGQILLTNYRSFALWSWLVNQRQAG